MTLSIKTHQIMTYVKFYIIKKCKLALIRSIKTEIKERRQIISLEISSFLVFRLLHLIKKLLINLKLTNKKNKL